MFLSRLAGVYNAVAQIFSPGPAPLQTDVNGRLLVDIAGNLGATVDSPIGAGTAPTNQIVVGSQSNITIPAPTAGQTLALQSDSTGSLYVNTEGRKATYRAAFFPSTLGTSVTITLFGSATKVVRITRIRLSVNAAAQAEDQFTITKFSSAPTGGTSAALTIVPMDANSPAATVTNAQTYTVVPTGGLASVGLIDLDILVSSAATPTQSGDNTYDMSYGALGTSHLVLRGVAQGIGIGYSVAGHTTHGFIEWTEE